jgi:type IV fimbrial biogenesis protein FimT
VLTFSRRRAGFTLIELLVTISLIGILIAMAAPSVRTMFADGRVRSTAEALTAALRTAQSTAVARSRIAVFAMTNTTPAYNATAVDGGTNWFTEVLPQGDETQATLGTLQTYTVARQYGVTVAGAGTGVTCFNSLGKLSTQPDTTTGVGLACTAPSDGSPITFAVSRSGAVRKFNVVVYPGGRVRMCDALKTLSYNNPDGC